MSPIGDEWDISRQNIRTSVECIPRPTAVWVRSRSDTARDFQGTFLLSMEEKLKILSAISCLPSLPSMSLTSSFEPALKHRAIDAQNEI